MPRRLSGRHRAVDARPSRFPTPTVELVLFVSAESAFTPSAVHNCQRLLKRFDRRGLRFDVCDVSREPERAESEAIVYTPVLVKKTPLPRACVLGDLSNEDALIELLESCGLVLMR